MSLIEQLKQFGFEAEDAMPDIAATGIDHPELFFFFTLLSKAWYNWSLTRKLRIN